MTNSKKKGSRGELEVVHLLKSHGFEARRSAQYMGTHDSSDVLCPELDVFNIESKFTEVTALEKWILKALEDAPLKVPMIFHRRTRECWKITMRADDLLPLFKRWNMQCLEQTDAP